MLLGTVSIWINELHDLKCEVIIGYEYFRFCKRAGSSSHDA